ncbi:hypothetical protein Tco_0773051 [Tanacetum coccineum]|uniref:Uncharacterized protein n=1 Tax=Tanacetum coccineum TaxID=301880 RepID=A0ABQ4ZN50_9ASTR
MKRVNTFIPMDQEVESSKKDEAKNKSKRAGEDLESNMTKKQKLDEQEESNKHEEVEKDDDPEEYKMKKHMQIVINEDIIIKAIPLFTKPLMIVEYKIIKEGIFGHSQLIRANGISKRYSSIIKMIQSIAREDLETLLKLVKTKHGDTRPEDEFERVLWGDLKVMFEPDMKSKVWRSLQGYTLTGWKLFDSCGVHYVRFSTVVYIFMLVEKSYPLTPITITNMLNKKLQADHWNEICYQLLKLMLNQDKYVAEILKKYNYINVKSASTLVDLEKPLVQDGNANDIDAHLYRSMIGSLMYLTTSRPDIIFVCKKQTVVATSTTEAKYVAAASCCGQVLWIQNQLLDYGYNFMNTVIHIDNNNLLTKGFDAGRISKVFWCTASARTLDNGEIELIATVDGQEKTITEASVRRHLKLADADGISTLLTTKIFEKLALMGYVTDSDKLTFQKGHFSPQ